MIDIGKYYPRIARPIDTVKSEVVCPLDELSSNINLAGEHLERIIDSLHLALGNSSHMLSSHGKIVRELLIIAATEVEAQFVGVLRANNYPGTNSDTSLQKLTTNDFHHLNDPLKLGRYTIRFNDLPQFSEFSPFSDWDGRRPTQSLSWLTVYNAVKHDREANTGEATLKQALDAIAAFAVTVIAQGYTGYAITNNFTYTLDYRWSENDIYRTNDSTTWTKNGLFS